MSFRQGGAIRPVVGRCKTVHAGSREVCENEQSSGPTRHAVGRGSREAL